MMLNQFFTAISLVKSQKNLKTQHQIDVPGSRKLNTNRSLDLNGFNSRNRGSKINYDQDLQDLQPICHDTQTKNIFKKYDNQTIYTLMLAHINYTINKFVYKNTLVVVQRKTRNSR